MFFGRFVLGLRVWASWLAGATRMRWRSFVLWNALGGHHLGDCAIGLIAYFLGHSAGNAIEAFGIYGLRSRCCWRSSARSSRTAATSTAGPARPPSSRVPSR